MNQQDMTATMAQGDGFIAALDQSGSTPKALKGYGVEESEYTSEADMFDLIDQVSERIILSPSFTGDKVVGSILFERTMDGQAGAPGAARQGRAALHQAPDSLRSALPPTTSR